MKHLEVEFYCSGQAESLDEDFKAIEFSSKMVAALKNKVRDHNLKNDKNITLDTLKATFTNALTETFDSSLALAKVNMFLNSSSAGYIDDGNHFERSPMYHLRVTYLLIVIYSYKSFFLHKHLFYPRYMI